MHRVQTPGAACWWFLATVLLTVGCASARPIPDEALLPLPEVLTMEGSEAGSCGMGNDAECGRTFLVSAASGQSSSDAVELAARHLEDAKGYDLSRQDDGSFVGCRDVRHCAWVEPFSDSYAGRRFTDRPSEWPDEYGTPVSRVGVLEERGAAVYFSDCC